MTDDDARGRILEALWGEIRSLNEENVRNCPAAVRAIEGGANPHDLVQALTAASYGAVFRTLYILTGEEDLEEISADVAMLHEDCWELIRQVAKAAICSSRSPGVADLA